MSSASDVPYNRGAVRPMECFREGWRLVKAEYWFFLGVTLVGILIGSAAPMAILTGPMMCGIYLCLLRRIDGSPATFNDLFQGFSFFLPSFLATLVMMVPTILLLIPFYIGMFASIFTLMPQPQPGGGPPPPPDPAQLTTFFVIMGALFLAMMVGSLLIGMFFIFAYPLIVDRRLSAMAAVGLGIRAVFANFGGLLGLMILQMIFSMIGLLMCYVGAIFEMPIAFAAFAVAYRKVFPALPTVHAALPEDVWPPPERETGITPA